MSKGALFWLIVFGLATVCFFVIAGIVAIKGTEDLKDLLHHGD
jgi:hypothetical protein